MLQASKILISSAAVLTLAAALYADMNETHVFNAGWPPHARFHASVALFVTAGWCAVAVWLAWRKTQDAFACMTTAALMPIVSWYGHYMTFFLVGPSETERMLGVPSNLLGGGVIMAISIVGYILFLNARDRARQS